MKVRGLIIIFVCLFFGVAFAQPSKSFIKKRDSILSLPNDSLKVEALIQFCKENGYTEYNEVMTLSKVAFELATKQRLFKKKAKLYNAMGDMLFNRANYQESFRYYYAGFKLSDSIGSRYYKALSAYNLGWQAALQQKNYKDVSYIYLALSIGEELQSKPIILRTQNALGSFYTDKYEREKKTADFDSALKYFNAAIDLSKTLATNKGVGALYSNLAQLFYYSKDHASSMFYNEQAKRMFKGDSNSIVMCVLRIGMAKADLNNSKEALDIYKFVYRYTINHNLIELRKDCLSTLVKYYKSVGDYKETFDTQREYIELNDKINKDLHAFTISNLETDYNYVKSETSNIQLKQAGEIAELKNKRKTIYISLLALVGLVIVVIAYLLFRQNKIKQQSNLKLTEQNKIIREKKEEIEQSIQYAKGIQTSFLPDVELLDIFLPNNFIFYQPKDVVSGDFYWFQTSKDNKQILVACADCTGHGVPGALMSMVGINMLQQFCGVEKLHRPSNILKNLNNEIKNSLKQNSDHNKQRDGMDIALIRLDLKENKLVFSAANRSLYILRNKEIIELKPTKFAIGGYTQFDQVFDEHELTLHKGDLIVMTTDGFADQFGGDSGKKYMTRKFKDLLISINGLSSIDQQLAIQSAFNEWKGNYDQVDDVCVVGINV